MRLHRWLLNDDIVLNVELVVHIHNVNLDALAALVLAHLRAPLSSTSFHVSRDDPLHMEELLRVGSGLGVLHAGAARPTVGLLLNVLSGVRAANAPDSATATGGLRGRLVLALHANYRLRRLRLAWILMMQAAAVLVHVRTTLRLLLTALFAIVGLVNSTRMLVSAAVPVLHETLVSVAHTLLHAALKHIAVLNVLDLLVCSAARVSATVLLGVALVVAHVANVTVLIDRARLVRAFLARRHYL